LAHFVNIPVIREAPISDRMVDMTFGSSRFRTLVDQCARTKGHSGSARAGCHFEHAAPIDTVGLMDAWFIPFAHLVFLSIYFE
jgi:hypothetical protein